MAELRPFKTYTGVQKRSASARKVGVAHALRDYINREVSSLSADKINELLLYNKKLTNKI